MIRINLTNGHKSIPIVIREQYNAKDILRSTSKNKFGKCLSYYDMNGFAIDYEYTFVNGQTIYTGDKWNPELLNSKLITNDPVQRSGTVTI
jgi:hypothetical protein